MNKERKSGWKAGTGGILSAEKSHGGKRDRPVGLAMLLRRTERLHSEDEKV
jgi:hypothetical protein